MAKANSNKARQQEIAVATNNKGSDEGSNQGPDKGSDQSKTKKKRPPRKKVSTTKESQNQPKPDNNRKEEKGLASDLVKDVSHTLTIDTTGGIGSNVVLSSDDDNHDDNTPNDTIENNQPRLSVQ